MTARGGTAHKQEEVPMGSMTDVNIEAWQKAAGLEPSPERELLWKMSNAAFELIKVIELERSGIRDGDGYWHGSDAMGGIASNLADLIEAYRRNMDEEWRARLKKKGISPTPDFCDGPFGNTSAMKP
jgi:hypothetical protein